jgi:hypothetical protein
MFMTSVRAANTRHLVFTANCHKSLLPHFAGAKNPQNWQFVAKWRPNRRSVKERDF